MVFKEVMSSVVLAERRCLAVLPMIAAITYAGVGCRTTRTPSTTSEVALSPVPEDASVEGALPERSATDPERDAAVDDGSTSHGSPSKASSPWTAYLVLEHASHPSGGGPTVVVHAPPGYDPTPPLELVVFLHGWSGCAAVLEGTGLVACRPDDPDDRRLEGWGLGERHDVAGTNTLFVVPQLAYMARDGSPGRFAEKGFFRDFLDELLEQGLADRIGGPRTIADVDHVTLVAHSAGFKTALSIIQQGGTDDIVKDVVLFDALYAAPAIFAQWVAAPPQGSVRKIVSLYTAKGRTYRFSQMLAQYLTDSLGAEEVALDPTGPLDVAIRTHRAVIARSPVGHGSVPARHLAEVIGALDLRRRPTE